MRACLNIFLMANWYFLFFVYLISTNHLCFTFAMISAKSAITERAMRLIIPKFVPGRREFIPVRRSTVNYDSKAAGPADKPTNAALLQENSRYTQSINPPISPINQPFPTAVQSGIVAVKHVGALGISNQSIHQSPIN